MQDESSKLSGTIELKNLMQTRFIDTIHAICMRFSTRYKGNDVGYLYNRMAY